MSREAQGDLNEDLAVEDPLCSVHLILTSDALDPAHVSQLLQLVPNQSWKKNDQKIFKSGSVHVYPWGGWKLFQPEPLDKSSLETQLDYWCTLLSQKREALHLLIAEGVLIELNCFISHHSAATVYLDNYLLKQIAELGVCLEFAIFAHESEQGREVKEIDASV